MKLKRNLSCVCLVPATVMVPALAQTVINSPTNGEQVSSPFTLNMTASTCSSQPVGAVGYSLDNSGNTSSWPAQYINGPVAAPSGWHTLHVKVWNGGGGVCVTDVSIDVDATPAASSASLSGSVVPSNAVEVSSIQSLGKDSFGNLDRFPVPSSQFPVFTSRGRTSDRRRTRTFARRLTVFHVGRDGAAFFHHAGYGRLHAGGVPEFKGAEFPG